MRSFAIFLVLFMVFGSAPVYAQHEIGTWIDEKANSDNYFVKAGGMLLTGVAQVLEAPVKLVSGMGHGVVESEPSILCPEGKMKGYVMGLLKGTGQGTYDALENVVAAAGNIVYSIIPGLGPLYPDMMSEVPAAG